MLPQGAPVRVRATPGSGPWSAVRRWVDPGKEERGHGGHGLEGDRRRPRGPRAAATGDCFAACTAIAPGPVRPTRPSVFVMDLEIGRGDRAYLAVGPVSEPDFRHPLARLSTRWRRCARSTRTS